jgi:hypothetical protein
MAVATSCGKRQPLAGRLDHQPGARAVPGEPGGVEAGLCGAAFDDEGDRLAAQPHPGAARPVGCIAADCSPPVDRAERWSAGQPGRLLPCLPCADRAGRRVRARAEPDAAGLAPWGPGWLADEELQAGRGGDDVGDVEADQSGWRWSTPSSSAAGWSAAPGPATAGTADPAAAHDLLAQALSPPGSRPPASAGSLDTVSDVPLLWRLPVEATALAVRAGAVAGGSLDAGGSRTDAAAAAPAGTEASVPRDRPRSAPAASDHGRSSR